MDFFSSYCFWAAAAAEPGDVTIVADSLIRTVRERMVPSRVRRAQGAAGTEGEVVLSGL